MSITTDLALSLDLTFAGTKLSHVIAGAIECTRNNGERFAALLTDTVNMLVLFVGVPDLHDLWQHRIGALFGAIHLVGRWWSMEHHSADWARYIVLDFVGGGYSKLSETGTFAAAIMVLVFLSTRGRNFLRLTTGGTVDGHSLAGGAITAWAAAILLIPICSRCGKSLAALLALATFGELRGTHKRNLLSDGWHVCLGHAGPTGGIHNYIRLWANHQAQACPKPLHYSTGVLAGVIP